MEAVFPLWKINTSALINDFINSGFKSVICCTNDEFLGEAWLGKEIDSGFTKDLPLEVDACGENGEYHSFCYEGPIFRNKINFLKGEKIFRPLEINTSNDCDLPASQKVKGFWFMDFLPVAIGNNN